MVVEAKELFRASIVRIFFLYLTLLLHINNNNRNTVSQLQDSSEEELSHSAHNGYRDEVEREVLGIRFPMVYSTFNFNYIPIRWWLCKIIKSCC